MADDTKVVPQSGKAASENSADNVSTAQKAEKQDQAPAAEAAKKPAKKKAEKFENPFSAQDPIQSRLVNNLMRCGKKTIARKILKDMFAELHARGEEDPLKTFEKALQNASPTMEVRPRRVGGAIYQIPVEVTPKRQETLPIRWILAGARSKKGQPMYKRLAGEILDASKETGFAYNKKEEVHKIAQANKAFAHLARY
ncbi:MAG: 30S ribosomal protein S7 [Candidatus Gracilibacteria bacterium]|nr:30S ribosomal protein S7 [Candidatus Gracilibacteria bacterium]